MAMRWGIVKALAKWWWPLPEEEDGFVWAESTCFLLTRALKPPTAHFPPPTPPLFGASQRNPMTTPQNISQLGSTRSNLSCQIWIKKTTLPVYVYVSIWILLKWFRIPYKQENLEQGSSWGWWKTLLEQPFCQNPKGRWRWNSNRFRPLGKLEVGLDGCCCRDSAEIDRFWRNFCWNII